MLTEDELFDRLKPFLWGFCGTIVAILIVGLLWAMTLTFLRSRNGEAAWECLHQPQCMSEAVKPLMKKE